MTKEKQYLIRRIFSDSQYDWMMINLPFRVMYVHKWIDSQHKMWMPRWGLSKQQMAEAENRANELFENIKWNCDHNPIEKGQWYECSKCGEVL